MCFYIPIGQRTKVAEENIICYKKVYIPDNVFNKAVNAKDSEIPLDWNSLGKMFYSVCYSFLYFLGNTYKTEMHVTKWRGDPNYVVTYGFHSYIDWKKSIDPRMRIVVIECTIPKGAFYFINRRTNEYVSESIRVDDVIYTNFELKPEPWNIYHK